MNTGVNRYHSLTLQFTCVMSIWLSYSINWQVYWNTIKTSIPTVEWIDSFVFSTTYTEVLRIQSSGFKVMTSRSWQYILCHCDVSSDHSTIVTSNEMYCNHILELRGDFKCTGSQIDWSTGTDALANFICVLSTTDRSTVRPKFHPKFHLIPWVWDHDHQIMIAPFVLLWWHDK